MSKEMRVNRQFYDLLNSDKRINILVGGSRCFTKDARVKLKDSYVKVSDLEIGDEVKTPNGLKKIIGLHQYSPTQKLIKFKFKNGSEITCTEDHLFFYKEEWVEAKHLLSLFHERNMD